MTTETLKQALEAASRKLLEGIDSYTPRSIMKEVAHDLAAIASLQASLAAPPDTTGRVDAGAVALLTEADRIIRALTVKSDCSLDRNQEFYDAAQWRGKVAALTASPASSVGGVGSYDTRQFSNLSNQAHGFAPGQSEPPATVNCPDCKGYGRVNDGSGARSPYGPKCPRCGGSGRILSGAQEVDRG